MGREESFASRLASGSLDMPPRTAWWALHSRAVSGYLASKAKGAYLRTVRDAALGHASQWDRWIPAAAVKGIMRQHAALEVELVDAARANDPKGVEQAGRLLGRNAAEQAAELAAKIPSFPEGRFRGLLEEHVSLFAERVRLAVEGSDARACERRAEANAVTLAAFTVEWL